MQVRNAFPSTGEIDSSFARTGGVGTTLAGAASPAHFLSGEIEQIRESDGDRLFKFVGHRLVDFASVGLGELPSQEGETHRCDV